MTGHPLKILVVDDEVLACAFVEKFLRREGYAPSSVYNGYDAVEKVRNDNFDVVLLDVRMPGMDGLETLKKIKDINEDIVAIMVTAVDEVGAALTSVKEGASDFLRKPVVLPELKHAIESSLEKIRLVQENREYRKNLEEKVAAQTSELREMLIAMKKNSLELVRALSEAIEAKDPYTRGHCRRVTAFSIALGKEIGLTGKQLEDLEYGTLLHDIGKIGVRDSVLGKPDKLTEDEYAHIQEHPVIGDKILSNIEFLRDARLVVRNHHERSDGKGYPDGVNNLSLDVLPKIVSIADAYDAMTSERPYRKGMSTERALSILKENKGTQFDPALVDIFISRKLYLIKG